MIRALAIMIMATAFCITTFMASGAEGQGGASKPGEVFRDCPDCPDMVVVPAGSFQMGSTVEERQSQGVAKIFADREEPLHRVTIAKPFAMSVYEVTRAVYKEFAGATHLTDAPGCAAYDPKTDTWSLQAGVSWHDPGFPQTDKDPAICISWADAHAFAEWLAAKTGKSYRLASEAEWEYAARAGTRTARYWGDAAEPACEKANIMTSATQEKLGWPKSWKNQLICTGDHAFTQPVGSYPPNTFGLYDMLGNAWEWVEDCYHDTYAGAPVDGSAWREAECKARMPRGGAFHSAPWLARAATRSKADPDYRGVASGIRIVRDIK